MKTALLAAIRESPDDDLPRLAYADWLEEQGDEPSLTRAEIIRVQLALARGNEADPRYPEWQRREAELLADHGAAWVRDELPQGMGLSKAAEGEGFRRGFPADVTCPWNDFLERGEELARCPVERLSIGGLEINLQWSEREIDRCTQLGACPSLARFPRLSLQCSDESGAQALLASSHLPELRELSLRCHAWQDSRIAEALARSDRLRQLESLTLSGFLRAGGLRTLLQSPNFRSLVKVRLGSNDLDDEVARLLGRFGPASSWRELNLASGSFGQAGICWLLQSAYLQNLELLDLSNLHVGHQWLGDPLVHAILRMGLPAGLRRLRLFSNGLSSPAVAALAADETLADLTELDLGSNEVGRDGAVALATASHLAGLTSLSMFSCQLDGEAITTLASSPHLRLRRVQLSFNPFGAKGMQALADSPVLADVREITLNKIDLGDKGAQVLAGAPWLRRLRELDLRENQIGDAGLEALARSAGLSGLVRLDLGGNWFGDRGTCALADSPHVARLRRLSLANSRIADEGAAALARSPHLHPLLAIDLSYNHMITPSAQALLRERFGERLTLRRNH